MNRTLVIGANGKTGRRVCERLQQMGLKVRKGSRTAEIPFDWHRPETWAPALEGTDKVYITYQPDLAVPGALETIKAFIDKAQSAGIRKAVLLSGRGEKEALACEQALQASKLNHTIVRASWFMQNFSENFLLDGILAGHLVLPKVDTAEPFIDIDDIADVVVASLTQDHHKNKVYEVTGPELLTFAQVVGQISNGLGREIVLEEIPLEAYLAALEQYQLPQDMIWLLGYLFSEVLDGRNAYVTSDVQEALGRKPGDLKDFVEKTIRTKVWDNIVEA